MQITTRGLLALSIRPLINTLRKFMLRRQIAFLEQEKQIIIDNRRTDFDREKEINRAQIILQADLNLLERI